MKTYSEFRPSQFDSRGLGLDSRQHWLVAPVSQTRDSGPLDRSNFRVALASLGGESETVEVHRFGHWGPGWFEIIVIDPADEARIADAEGMEAALSDYPVLNEMDFSELEQEEANETWEHCYSPSERLEYIRDHRSQFEFRGFADLMGCVRGKYFAGYASELLG